MKRAFGGFSKGSFYVALVVKLWNSVAICNRFAPFGNVDATGNADATDNAGSLSAWTANIPHSKTDLISGVCFLILIKCYYLK